MTWNMKMVVIGCADVERKGGSYEVRREGGVRVWGEEGGRELIAHN